MNCEPIRGLLSAYLDDQLSVPERQSVAAHLDTCIECSAILSDYYRFDALLAQLPYLTPPSLQPRNVLCHAPNRYRIQTLAERQKTVLTLVPLPLHSVDMQLNRTYHTYSTRPSCSIHLTPAPQERINAKKSSRTHIVILLLITTIGLLFLQYLYPRKSALPNVASGLAPDVLSTHDRNGTEHPPRPRPTAIFSNRRRKTPNPNLADLHAGSGACQLPSVVRREDIRRKT